MKESSKWVSFRPCQIGFFVFALVALVRCWLFHHNWHYQASNSRKSFPSEGSQMQDKSLQSSISIYHASNYVNNTKKASSMH